MILKLVGDIKRGGIQILGVKLKWQLYVLGVLFLKFGTGSGKVCIGIELMIWL